jgi:hypothetical protein
MTSSGVDTPPVPKFRPGADFKAIVNGEKKA